MITLQRELHIAEIEKSIIALAKRKLNLMSEVKEINDMIKFLQEQQDELNNV